MSGLALGTDTSAHERTLEKGGKTIAVLGGGVKKVYPTSNEGLARRITENGGLLVSEYTPYASPAQYHFPQRNRLITGLSKGLFISEAGLKSGVYATLKHAIEQGVPPYIVPGEIYSYSSLGSNEMIKSYHGSMVTSPEDVLRDLGTEYRAKEEKKHLLQLTAEEQKIAECLQEGKKHISEIMQYTGFPFADLNFTLANMELKSLVSKLPSNFYVLNTEAF